ncbi:MAG: methyltransferase domain-containing protein [Desulfuromonadales bacterium]
MERHIVKRTHRIIVTEELIRENAVEPVLEIGAGDYSFRYLMAGDEAKWLTVDFSPPCDVQVNLNDEKLKLPFESSSLTTVVCTEVLEHLLWPQQLVSEVYRILAPGGKFVLSVPNCVSLSYRVAWMLGRLPSCASGGNLPPELGSTAYRKPNGEIIGGHVVDFNCSRMVGLLNGAGFEVEKMRGSGIIWHRQILPYWMVPASFASNIICLAVKSRK